MLPIGAPPTFLFATHDGTISGWNAVLGMNGSTAQIVVNNGASNASYTGLALLTNTTGTYLLAANFGQAADIEVYKVTPAFQQAKTLRVTLPIPSFRQAISRSPYMSLAARVFVAYAMRLTDWPSFLTNGVTVFKQVVGAGAGIVDVIRPEWKLHYDGCEWRQSLMHPGV